MEKKFFRYRGRYSAYISNIITLVLYTWIPLICTKGYSIIGCLIFLLLIFNSDNILMIINKFPLIQKKGSFIEDNGILIIAYEGKIFKAEHVTGLSISKKNFWTQGVKLRIECENKAVEFLSTYMRNSSIVEETDLYYIFDLILSQNPSLVQLKDSEGKPVPFSYKENV